MKRLYSLALLPLAAMGLARGCTGPETEMSSLCKAWKETASIGVENKNGCAYVTMGPEPGVANYTHPWLRIADKRKNGKVFCVSVRDSVTLRDWLACAPGDLAQATRRTPHDRKPLAIKAVSG